MSDGRQRILAAASKLFARDGYERTSVEAIAKEAGVSKGLAYHHFASKDALLVAIVVSRLTELDGVVDALRAEPDARARLRLLVGHLVADLEQRPDHHRFLIATFIGGDGARIAAACRAERPAQFAALHDEEARALADLGYPADPAVLAHFRATLQGMALLYLQTPGAFPLREAAARVLDTWANGAPSP
jgi:AcrR family transcriptional regulator